MQHPVWVFLPLFYLTCSVVLGFWLGQYEVVGRRINKIAFDRQLKKAVGDSSWQEQINAVCLSLQLFHLYFQNSQNEQSQFRCSIIHLEQYFWSPVCSIFHQAPIGEIKKHKWKTSNAAARITEIETDCVKPAKAHTTAKSVHPWSAICVFKWLESRWPFQTANSWHHNKTTLRQFWPISLLIFPVSIFLHDGWRNIACMSACVCVHVDLIIMCGILCATGLHPLKSTKVLGHWATTHPECQHGNYIVISSFLHFLFHLQADLNWFVGHVWLT